MKKILLTFGVAALAAVGSAATFTAGGGQGTAIVDAAGTGDYTTLAAAAADFSSFTGGCTGDWTLLIRSNLTEAGSSVFGNSTNGHKVTVKPAPGVSPTVTFQYFVKPTGTWWDGGLIVGPKAQNANEYMAVNGFTVDGSNTNGGTTRDLKFINSPVPEGGTENPRVLLRVVGQSEVVVFKNCVVESVTAGAGDNIGIDYVARLAGGLNLMPNNGVVENCEIKVPVGALGIGVRGFNSGVPSGTAITGMTVRNNDITASLRAVHYALNAGGTIENNRISINQTAASRPQTILHQGANGVLDWTLNINGNRFVDIQTLDGGGWLYAIGVGAGVTTVGRATYNITNNMIGGFRYDYTGVANPLSTGWICRGISIETLGSGATYNIHQNSFNMENVTRFDNTLEDVNNRLGAISLLSAGNFAGVLNIQNNIFRYTQPNGTILSLRSGNTVGGTLNINNNTYAGSAIVANYNGTAYATLGNWKAATGGAAGQDAGSNVADPTVPAAPGAGKWVSATDLHFDADPGSPYKVALLPAVPFDFDGQTRAMTTDRGVDQFAPTSAVSEWMLF